MFIKGTGIEVSSQFQACLSHAQFQTRQVFTTDMQPSPSAVESRVDRVTTTSLSSIPSAMLRHTSTSPSDSLTVYWGSSKLIKTSIEEVENAMSKFNGGGVL